MDTQKANIQPKENPLGTRPLGKLLLSLAVPAIIANVVNALYNIVDQIFIGQDSGKLGNAATSVSFPLTTICMAIGLMTGLGAASGFNLELGRKNEVKAKKIAVVHASEQSSGWFTLWIVWTRQMRTEGIALGKEEEEPRK